MTLEDIDNPKRNEMISAVVSRMPHPPILTGKVMENSIIGAKTKKLIISISRLREKAHMIYVVI